ncbi:Helicase associated domain protein [Kitasatospora sp. NPDC001540]|uniref:DEAD/DEAH box helicase n=1 Tax=Kitasatospora sp. NPDC001540 TaxID=3364014 RepID=UPI003682A943
MTSLSLATDAPAGAPAGAALPGPRRTGLRPYQQEAVAAIVAGLADGGSGQWHACCGSGKTLVAQRAAEEILGAEGTVAVLVPSLALVAQTLASWRANSAVGPVEALAVCSDETVADAAAHLEDLPCAATTDPAQVVAWLRAPVRGRRLVVGTYQSADRLAEAVRGTRALDLLVLDEAHHLAGRADMAIARCLDRTRLPAVRSLFLTATPRIESGARTEGAPLLTMGDASVFGKVLHAYPFSRGIAEGYLEDYRVAVIGIADREARALLADAATEYVDRIGAPSLQTVVAQAALVKAREQFGVRRALTFHHRVDAAAEFSRTLAATAKRLGADTSGLYARHVHGEMPHAVRRDILHRLAAIGDDGQWAAVSSARCLAEGVDVPAVDGIVFAHPKKSAADIVQAVGRALRRHPDTPGPSTIIVPIVVPEQDGEIGDLEAGDYRTLWQVIRALRAHDEPLGIALDRQRSHSHTDNPQLPAKIAVVLPEGASQQVIDQLTLLTVRQSTSPWWEHLARARAFRAEHGHLDIPLRHSSPDGFKLGNWLVQQRTFHGKGWLLPERAAQLEELGIVWDPAEARWREMLQLCTAWHKEHGHLDVPNATTVTVDGAEVDIGNWLSHQRTYRRRGFLSEHRVAALDALGFDWSPNTSSWQRMIDAFTAYRDAHGGDPNVPLRHITDDGIRLGAWVNQTRFKGKRGKLPADRVEQLTAAGFNWEGGRYNHLDAVRAHYAEHGTLDDLGVAHGLNLGLWLERQRTAHRNGTLDAALTRELESFGIDWTPAAVDPWQRALAAARAFHARTGHLRPPIRHVEDDVPLSDFLIKTRKRRREGKLSPEQVADLDALGMVWEPEAADWQRALRAARAYHARTGHLRPPTRHIEDGYQLESFINRTRKRRREGKLTDQQIADLDALGMEWEPEAADWQRALDIARAFHARTGHLRPRDKHVEDGFGLYTWLYRQRRRRRDGKLTEQQIADLDALDMVWEPSTSTSRTSKPADPPPPAEPT